MNNCSILIKTVADEVENTVRRDGKFSIGKSVKICYAEQNAEIDLTIENGCARIERTGDYGMRLQLTPDTITAGTLSIGGNQGEIRVQTEKVECKATENGLRVRLQYALLLGKERQEMQLWIVVKERK
jgi:uncharacterized beta-barrel protein YwiB (DUF1934 family)